MSSSSWSSESEHSSAYSAHPVAYMPASFFVSDSPTGAELYAPFVAQIEQAWTAPTNYSAAYNEAYQAWQQEVNSSVPSEVKAGDSEPSKTASCEVSVPDVEIELQYVPYLNLSLQQSGLPLIMRLFIKNNTQEALENLSLRITSEPDYINTQEFTVGDILANSRSQVEVPLLELDYDKFSTLAATLQGSLSLSLTRNEQLVLNQSWPLQFFTADQWLGDHCFPQLLCAFVMPHLEVIERTLTTVADELLQETGSSAIQAYQAGKERAFEIFRAVYRALQRWGITYSVPPASFGAPGQRVRLADNIYKYRLGTCLDTTLLYASVLEQCGLNPVIFLMKGHAFVGCHLTPTYFPECIYNDLQAIRKAVALDDLAVVETTKLTSKSSFSQAEQMAVEEHLNNNDEFVFALDTKRARIDGVLPLPLISSVDGLVFDPVDRRAEAVADKRRRTISQDVNLEELAAHDKERASVKGRVDRWQQKLLDLSLRNRLLNVRDGMHTLPLACPDIAKFEDQLAAGSSYMLNSIMNLVSDTSLALLTSIVDSQAVNPINTLLEHEMQQRRIWTLLQPADAKRRLTFLIRQSKTAMEEGGVNTLFAALGFLVWKAREQDNHAYLAPLLLVPVQLERKSMAEGIRLKRLDEDTVINVTLLEMLKREFNLYIPGLDPLPTDDSGVDVPKVLRIFRQSIKDMKGWEVIERATLGHFSFGKFIMWNDLVNRSEALQQSPLVSHLIDGSGYFDDHIDISAPEMLTNHLKPAQIFCPMSADSSQLAAVLYSQTGKNFVLHGPPGTGKSQTITNIIAHNLALGRRVLFVAEKKAALEVVYRRLTAVGLAPFCLELHSNKSGKAEVMAQFAKSLAVPQLPLPDEEWAVTTDNLQKLRDNLAGYVQELHKVYSNGLSAYLCFSKLLAAHTTPLDNLFAKNLLEESKADFALSRQIVADLLPAWQATSLEALQAFVEFADFEWSPVAEKNLRNVALALAEICADLQPQATALQQVFGINGEVTSQSLHQLLHFAALLQDMGSLPAVFIKSDFADNIAFLENYAVMANEYANLQAQLTAYQEEALLQLDCHSLKERLSESQESWWLGKVMKSNAIVNELSSLKRLGTAKLTVEELEQLLPKVEQFQKDHKEYLKKAARAQELLGTLWEEGSPNWDNLRQLFAKAEALHKAVWELSGGLPHLQQSILEQMQVIMPNGKTTLAMGAPLFVQIQQMRAALEAFDEKILALNEFSSRDRSQVPLVILAQQLHAVATHSDGMRGAVNYFTVRRKAEQLGIGAFCFNLEAGQIAEHDMAAVFEISYYNAMLDAIIAVSPSLSSFAGLQQQERIRRFCQFDEKYLDLSKQVIVAKLAANLPQTQQLTREENKELALLKRECEKRTRQKPVRQLLEQIPHIVAKLKPCFLMSPLSVAQYLPADTAPFDLIVFDEASQIPVWDAIGVIARGQQLIVVGDSKQLPPTNFFQKGDTLTDETPSDLEEDMESILDECMACGLYSTYLNWHYRSRHESLIAFSNHHYYNDQLCTFPAADNSEFMGVHFEFVADGCFDRSGTRTNYLEASKLVEYVFRVLRTPALAKRSMGVVTFSEAQKTLIEDLLEKERLAHPELEAYFSDNEAEPFFVKNLENVQGDERDVILFSIGYAPDPNGSFSMNFGPLNRQGGERRLNVAVTRAKEQVVVFSSVHARQIDLNRTSAVGARHLRSFLEYAEQAGGQSYTAPCSRELTSNGLSEIIVAFLESQGYECDRQVGCSSYKLDLAVKNPQSPEEYLLAVECDGPVYASQRTVRDREHLRTSVLRSLGWHIFRAWSLDWCLDRSSAEKQLLEALESAKVDCAERARQKAENLAAMQAAAEAAAAEAASETATAQTVEGGDVESSKGSESGGAVVAESGRRQVYQIWAPERELPQNDFALPAVKYLRDQLMLELIDKEAPICLALLLKRYTRAWGFGRIGKDLKQLTEASLPSNLPRTHLGEQEVVWSAQQDPQNYHFYRVPLSDTDKRSIDEIPPEELLNAMQEVCEKMPAAAQEEIYRETLQLFNFKVLTGNARKCLTVVWDELQRNSHSSGETATGAEA